MKYRIILIYLNTRGAKNPRDIVNKANGDKASIFQRGIIINYFY